MIQYMSILKAYTYLGMGQLSTTEQALYFRLFLVNNLSGWGEWFGADNKRLMFECNINSKQTLERAKQRLKDLGFIDYIPGKKGKPTQYTLTPILKKGTFIVPYTGEETGAKTGENTGEETGRIYRHIDKDKDNTPKSPPGRSAPNLQEQRFAEFWQAYPKKQGKGAALKAYGKIKPTAELHKTMLDALERQKKSEQWQKQRGQFIPNPSTWLNQSRWEDELVMSGNYGEGETIPFHPFSPEEQIERRRREQERDAMLAAIAEGKV